MLQACTVEQVTEVSISSVSVLPESVSTLRGESLRLSATVQGEDGPLPGATPTWTSDAPEIASVDPTGNVTAHREGTVTVRASFRGAAGQATVRVLAGPTIELSSDSIAFAANEGGSNPSSRLVSVANSGNGELTALDVSVQFADDGAEWLTVVLEASTAPTQFEVSADIADLEPGVYAAQVTVSSGVSGIDAVSIPISLNLERCRRYFSWLPCDWRDRPAS